VQTGFFGVDIGKITQDIMLEGYSKYPIVYAVDSKDML